MSRRDDAVDSRVTVQVLMTTTSGSSPAWARSKPRAPSRSSARSDSAWFSRHPRVLNATLGAGAAVPRRSCSAIAVSAGEGVHERRLGRLARPGRRVDAHEGVGGEDLPPALAGAQQHPRRVAALGAVGLERPPDLLGHRRGVHPAAEALVGRAPGPERLVLPWDLD